MIEMYSSVVEAIVSILIGRADLAPAREDLRHHLILQDEALILYPPEKCDKTSRFWLQGGILDRACAECEEL